MSDDAAAPLLQTAQDSLRECDAAMLRGELPAMRSALDAALEALCTLALRGWDTTAQRDAAPAWDGELMERTVWQLLARLRTAGCSAFPFAGTLLGLHRDGRLLPGDKDADFAVWLEDFNLAVRALQAMGLQRAANVPPFGNMASLVEPGSGLTVDIFGIRREPEHQRLVGGVWLYGRPPEYQRIAVYPWFTLTEKAGPAGPVWWPEDPAVMLQALFGDWATPRPEWDSVVANPSVTELNLSWRCFSLKSLADRWLRGDAGRTRRLLDTIAARAGWDGQLERCARALDHLLAQPREDGA